MAKGRSATVLGPGATATVQRPKARSSAGYESEEGYKNRGRQSGDAKPVCHWFSQTIKVLSSVFTCNSALQMLVITVKLRLEVM
jgi:hypothetical protein